MRRFALALGLLGCGTSTSSAAEPPPPAQVKIVPASRVPAAQKALLGQAAPTWEGEAWLEAEQDLQALRGKVVFVRFFTDTCPFCRASAPALRELDETYRDRGLVVVGMYHPKPPGTVAPDKVAAFAKEHGWSFPVGLDADWSTLDKYWAPQGRRYTSVSFLIDKAGAIRFIHPGPEYHPAGPEGHTQCRSDFAEIKAAIEALL